jgi:hypothetical protein
LAALRLRQNGIDSVDQGLIHGSYAPGLLQIACATSLIKSGPR